MQGRGRSLDIGQARHATGLAVGMDQRAVEVQVEVRLSNRDQRERVNGFVEVGEQAARQAERLVFESMPVMNDELHTPLS